MRSRRYLRWMRLFQSFRKGQDKDQHCLLRQTAVTFLPEYAVWITNRAHSVVQNKIRRSQNKNYRTA